MTKKLLKKVLVLFISGTMVMLGGCGANDDSSQTFAYDSDKAAIEAYVTNEANGTKDVGSRAVVGHSQGEKGSYYFIQKVDESGTVIIHIAVVTEHDGTYSCEKCSPDYELDAASPDDNIFQYTSIPFENKYLNVGVLDSSGYSVSAQGEKLEVNEAGVFFHVDKTEQVTFNCSAE
ncbi:MAG: hypothetical protein MR492_03250 [Clostridiales bacterium]|nr:hypothetical protein [Clostridiales bacterium]MDY4958817.1 hypothetical protein [Lentihominibacter sp.]